MAIDLLKTLDDLKGRWMIGGSALEKAPAAWKKAAEEDSSPDLALLVLAGQALQFAVRPTPGGKLVVMPRLPKLTLPTPPAQARQQIRNLVRVIKWSDSQMASVVKLLAARGYVLHPVDYMPRNLQSLPDVYAPWVAWKQSDGKETSAASENQFEALDADNWDHWLPAERRAAFERLRREDPQQARDLMTEKGSSLAADQRLKLLEVFSETLSGDDQTMLEGFVKDRSAKVRKLVAQYLGRIGAVEHEANDIKEYADFFTVAKRHLRGGYKITPNKLKTKPQLKRRTELATQLSLQSFVQGLKLNNESELLKGWQHVDEIASDELVRMVAATGSDEAAAELSQMVLRLDGISAEAFQQLFERMGKASRSSLLPRVLENDTADLSAAVLCAESLVGQIPFAKLKDLKALKELKKIAAEDMTLRNQRQEKLRQGLISLGLLADQSAAIELMKLFTESNMFASDPMLGLLKLNACLPSGEPV